MSIHIDSENIPITQGAQMNIINAGHRIYSLKENEGEARWWLGGLAIIKASGKDTDGRFSLVEVVDAEGAVTPLHVHHNEDEAFWILEGSLTFEVGDQTIKAERGSFLFGPKDIPHRYHVDKGPARLLFLLSPAGFEDFIRDTSEPASTPTLPPPSDMQPSPEEMEQLVTVLQKYGGEILG